MQPHEVRLGFWLSLFISAKVVYKTLSRLRWEVWALLCVFVIAQQVAWHNFFIQFTKRNESDPYLTSLALSVLVGLAGVMLSFLFGMLFKSVILDTLIPSFFEKFEQEALPYQKRELERVDETLLIDSRESWRDKLK